MVSEADAWKTAEKVNEFLSEKYCIARVSRTDCGPNIIHAHTIPKSQLREIALNGHIYHLSGTFADLKKTDGNLVVKKKGISDFSTLNCFCNTHDASLFRRVEADELTFDREQTALLHYRAMAGEVYKKIGTYKSALSHIEDVAKLKKVKEREAKLEFLKPYTQGQYLALRDIIPAFKVCDDIIVNNAFDSVQALVVLFKNAPTIMSVGAFMPEFDFDGKVIQALGDFDKQYAHVSVSILASAGRAAAAIAWLKEANFKSRFAQTLVSKPPEHLTTLIIQLAFEHLENTCMNITWWESLNSAIQGALIRRMQSGGTFVERKNSCLEYCGVTFDNWEYDRHHFID